MPVPPALPPSSFVSTTARLAMVMAGLGLAWSVVQLGLAALMPDRAVAELAALPEIPPGLVWLLEQRVGLSALLLLASLLFLACSWGLLRRHEWGRIGFIVFLVLTGLLNFLALPAIDHVFDTMRDLLPAGMRETEEGRELLTQIGFSRAAAWISGLLGALAFAALHGWVAWKLCTRAVRREFRADSA
jgi:hypothetical protein